MSEFDRQKQGRIYEGLAFTFCKAALLALIFQRYTLLMVSGCAVTFYLMASMSGIKDFKCWAKPPWVTIFWAVVFAEQAWVIWHHPLPFWL